MDHRHLKKCSSLAMSELQIETTMKYHLMSAKVAIINRSRIWRKGNPSAMLVGMQTGAATVEDSMEFPKKN